MEDLTGLAQWIGSAMQAIGLVAVAIKTGNWKGVTDNKIQDLESNVKEIRIKVEAMDDRLDGVEKEFSKTLVRLESGIEYIKESIDELKKNQRKG